MYFGRSPREYVRLNSCQRKIDPNIKESSSVMVSSKSRGARRMISRINTNTIVTSVKEEVCLCVS